MKRYLVTCLVLFYACSSIAQTNTFPTTGKVGVGTTSPASLLHLNGTSTTNASGDVILILQAAHSSSTIGSGGIVKFTNNVASANVASIRTYTEGASNVSLRFQTGYGTGALTDRMTISNSGNVGIGTTTPAEKLSVKGKIRAQEVKVEMANWADFVFAKDFKLPTLKETEKHIQEKGHLPGIPSAAEVEKNGIELGDMNKKLLQKIEELTLYLIEQEKKIQTLNNQVENLQENQKR
ncbi:hypothetical protein [Pedobacter ginsengisoli]|uniref:hypothetical protein n=1 Tax=Pedobacter ginsengisoli TaxID=363852 RepID=UPI00254DD911|nr:hypothetical protein [Pedobacter ginsengisoli]